MAVSRAKMQRPVGPATPRPIPFFILSNTIHVMLEKMIATIAAPAADVNMSERAFDWLRLNSLIMRVLRPKTEKIDSRRAADWTADAIPTAGWNQSRRHKPVEEADEARDEGRSVKRSSITDDWALKCASDPICRLNLLY